MTLKLLLLVLVIAVAAWFVLGRRGKPPAQQAPKPPRPAATPPAPPQAMLACAHCGVHLPGSEARMDAAGRPYCSDAHRLAGPA